MFIYVLNKTMILSYEKNNLYYKKTKIDNENEKYNVEDYLLNIYYTINSFFKDIKDYNPCNLIFYKYLSVPSIESIIRYLSDNNNISEHFDKIISNKLVKKKNYFDYLSHHLFITPYLLNSKYFEQVKQYPNLELILQELNNIDNLWINLDNVNLINYRILDPNIFLEKWEKIINKFNVNINKEITV